MVKLDTHSNELALVGRVLYSSLFVVYGYFKITAFAGTTVYMGRQGLPAPALFAALAVLFELGGGLLLLAGYQTRLVALSLAVYVIVAILIAHRNWADANQLAHFWKGVTIAGGGFALAALGGGRFSMDGRRG
jgi:putative oxidoreductase